MEKQTFVLRGLNFWLYAVSAVLTPYLPLYFEDRGYTSSQIGFMLMIGPLVATLFQPIWGYASDRLQTTKNIIGVLWGLTIGFGIVMFQATSYTLTLITVMMMYFFLIPSHPLLDSTSIQEANRRGSSYGSIRVFGSIGYAVISIAAGMILSQLGGITHFLSTVFWIVWIAPVILLLFLKDMPPQGERVSLQAFKSVLHNKSFLLFLMLVFLISVPHRMNDAMFALVMKQSGAEDAMVGWAWALAAATEIPAFVLLNRYLGKVHEFVLLAIAGILFSLRWLLYAAASTPLAFFLLQGGAAVTYAVFWIAAVQYTARSLPKELTSTGQSLLGMVFLGLAGMTGGTIGGWLNDTYGSESMYLFGSLVALIAGICFLVRSRRTLQEDGISKAG